MAAKRKQPVVKTPAYNTKAPRPPRNIGVNNELGDLFRAEAKKLRSQGRGAAAADVMQVLHGQMLPAIRQRKVAQARKQGAAVAKNQRRRKT